MPRFQIWDQFSSFFLFPTGRVCFIDYEYAGYNYQAFDIGNHFNEFAGRGGDCSDLKTLLMTGCQLCGENHTWF